MQLSNKPIIAALQSEKSCSVQSSALGNVHIKDYMGWFEYFKSLHTYSNSLKTLHKTVQKTLNSDHTLLRNAMVIREVRGK